MVNVLSRYRCPIFLTSCFKKNDNENKLAQSFHPPSVHFYPGPDCVPIRVLPPKSREAGAARRKYKAISPAPSTAVMRALHGGTSESPSILVCSCNLCITTSRQIIPLNRLIIVTVASNHWQGQVYLYLSLQILKAHCETTVPTRSGSC